MLLFYQLVIVENTQSLVKSSICHMNTLNPQYTKGGPLRTPEGDFL